jgi:Zn-finger nucleic acid-binding protein
MNCQNCGAPMKFDHNRICFWCEYCTSIHFPEESIDGIRISDEESIINCPMCNIPLVLAYAGKTQVFYCNKCRGILINQFSFLIVIQYIRSKAKELSTPPPVRLEELERKTYCPQCHRKMDTHPYGGSGNIVIDNCPHCMLNWLDYNELYRVTHAPDRNEIYRNREEDFETLLKLKKRYKDK